MTVEKLLKNKKGTIVDVRTRSEYSGGHVVGSVNIPLNELPSRFEEFKQMKQPLIVCCATGVRSAQAEDFLNHQGMKSLNGGSWLEINYLQSNNS